MRPRPARTSPALSLFCGLGLIAGAALAADPPGAAERARMIERIERHAGDATDALGREHIDPKVLEVMGSLPREAFVPAAQRPYAYDDRPLPIGYGQTISQPFIVALMTDMLQLEPDDVVLEVGTGSGYQAAVLARLVEEVHTMEIIPELAARAEEALSGQALDNAETYVGDGYYGVEQAAPFEAIIVTAAASHVPPPLIAQLAPGGRMVIPVGGAFALQHLMLIEKDADGQVRSRQTLPVAFVPLTRGS
jgi:protein-L-isoaspartate(D-aspartate) O-methyltransferase